MSLIPDSTLAKIWHNLDKCNKKLLSNEINSIFLELRQLKYPEKTLLGRIGDNSYKNVQGNIKRCNKLLYTGRQF